MYSHDYRTVRSNPNITELRANGYQSVRLKQEDEELDFMQEQVAQVSHQAKGRSSDHGSLKLESFATLEKKPKVQHQNSAAPVRHKTFPHRIKFEVNTDVNWHTSRIGTT